jgi:hypothetical protein
MKIDKAEREAQTAEMVKSDGPEYPYGLSVHLDNDALEKVGLSTLPKVEGTMLLVARVKVVSVSSNEHEGMGKHRSVGLQITDMALEKDGGKDAAATLYDGDKAEK